MRLIDADELKKDIDGYDYSEEGYSDRMDFKFIYEVIDNQPTVEAKPVVHGEWKSIRDKDKKKCSVCGVIHLIAQYPFGNANFCPNCGCDMRGKNDGRT